MTQKEYVKLQEAINTLCNFCECDDCDKCRVEALEEDAYVEAGRSGLLSE